MYWFQVVGHLTSQYYCKSSWHVAHQWRDLIINIQRSRTPFVFEKCLIPLQSVLNTDSDESLSPTAYSQIVCTAEVNAQMHDHCQSTCRFISNVFSVFFRWTRPSNVYCRQSSCLDLGTAQGMISQLTSDPVSTTHQILIWSPPTLLYRNWLLIRSRTPIRCQK